MLIDLSNYATTLIQSTQGRAGTPDGNIFFDKANGLIEFIPSDEVATLDLTSIGGGATDPNPLDRQDGVRFEAIYAFENQERAADESLRLYDRWTGGTFKAGGAYNFVSGKLPSTDPDRQIIRGSGWNELDLAGSPTRIYFGNRGLSNIYPGSQPYYQLGFHSQAIDYAKVGQIDEAVQVYGDALNGNFDSRSYEAVSVRTYGNTHDRKETTNDLGITELGGYYTGFAIDESTHLTTNEIDHPFADVSTVPAGVWANMELNYIGIPVAKTGEFADETGSREFSWELINNDGANLDQMIAWLDAFATEPTKEADGLGVNLGHLGKNADTWYYYDATGTIITRSGVDPSTEGLYLNNIPSFDQQRVVMTDDSGALKDYAFTVAIEADIGSAAKADANAWFHSFFAAAYNTAGAITVEDKTNIEIKGLASSADLSNKIIKSFDYNGDTLGGPANTDKDCVFLCEGDGGATQAKTLYTITKIVKVSFSCAPAIENNV